VRPRLLAFGGAVSIYSALVQGRAAQEWGVGEMEESGLS
jgi:hypothetical protein